MGTHRNASRRRRTRFVCTSASNSPARRPLTGTSCEPSSRRGPTRSCSSAWTTDALTRLTINQELAAGDTLLLRAKGTTIEAWRNDGSSLVATRPRHRFDLRRRWVHRHRPARDDRPPRRLRCARASSLNPPGPPTATRLRQPATGNVALSWTAPSSTAARRSPDYRVYRGTSAGTETFLANAGTSTTLRRLGTDERNDLLLQGVGRERQRRGPALERGLRDPGRPRPPDMPLPTIDNFDRLNENPLSDAGRWTNGVIGSGETGLNIPNNWLACSRRRPARHGATTRSTAPTPSRGHASRRFPARRTRFVCTCASNSRARPPPTGTAANHPAAGPTRSCSSAWTTERSSHGSRSPGARRR